MRAFQAPGFSTFFKGSSLQKVALVELSPGAAQSNLGTWAALRPAADRAAAPPPQSHQSQPVAGRVFPDIKRGRNLPIRKVPCAAD